MKYRKLTASAFLSVCALAALPALGDGPAAAPRPAGPRMGTQPLEVLMTKITVSDLQKSHDFYTKIIGLKLVTSPDMPLPGMPKPGDPEKDFVEVPFNYSGSMADAMFVLMKRRGKVPVADQAALTMVVFKVPDTSAVMDRAARAGITPARPSLGGGTVGFLRDPDGYSVEILQAPSYPAH